MGLLGQKLLPLMGVKADGPVLLLLLLLVVVVVVIESAKAILEPTLPRGNSRRHFKATLPYMA